MEASLDQLIMEEHGKRSKIRIHWCRKNPSNLIELTRLLSRKPTDNWYISLFLVENPFILKIVEIGILSEVLSYVSIEHSKDLHSFSLNKVSSNHILALEKV
jgi:hypothetical protein